MPEPHSKQGVGASETTSVRQQWCERRINLFRGRCLEWLSCMCMATSAPIVGQQFYGGFMRRRASQAHASMQACKPVVGGKVPNTHRNPQAVSQNKYA